MGTGVRGSMVSGPAACYLVRVVHQARAAELSQPRLWPWPGHPGGRFCPTLGPRQLHLVPATDRDLMDKESRRDVMPEQPRSVKRSYLLRGAPGAKQLKLGPCRSAACADVRGLNDPHCWSRCRFARGFVVHPGPFGRHGGRKEERDEKEKQRK
ncbi:hypothetical protein CB1_000417002 [Camelus ferus]|nr:hypothetical protein CB1_000417002 [Camelus ferus]